jgi:nickel-dependent lactate racemase
MVVFQPSVVFNMEIFKEHKDLRPLTEQMINEALLLSIKNKKINKILLIPPDITRYHSNAGYITKFYYHTLNNKATVDILPALGTHEPMTKAEIEDMYGDIPLDRFIVHRWRDDVVKVGTVPASYVSKITDGLWQHGVTMELNKHILDASYDLIISIGQVVPHEVIGMANHSKNIFVGCGGKSTINESHMIGAIYGMERMMGKDHTPVRKVLDYAWQQFIKDLPLIFVLTVTTAPEGNTLTHGLYIGDTRKVLEKAIEASQKININFVDEPIKKCVVYLDPKEFKSTWLGNKAIYRTRMAIQDGGELVILAPGIEKFGEDSKIDQIIRAFGYVGREQVLNLFKSNKLLQNNMGAAAHLIHSSSDGRFKITYAVKNISLAEIDQVNFNAMRYEDAIRLYPLEKLKPGYQYLDNGEKIFFIQNPALGLWIDRHKFESTKT